MSIPQIPKESYRPSLSEVTIDLLKSVAMEETALSHILNAEGERSQALVKRLECTANCDPCLGSQEFCAASRDLENSMRQSEKIISTIIMKEWLLLKKLETTLEINQALSPTPPSPTPCRPCQHSPCSPSHCTSCSNSGNRCIRCGCRCSSCRNACKCSTCRDKGCRDSYYDSSDKNHNDCSGNNEALGNNNSQLNKNTVCSKDMSDSRSSSSCSRDFPSPHSAPCKE